MKSDRKTAPVLSTPDVTKLTDEEILAIVDSYQPAEDEPKTHGTKQCSMKSLRHKMMTAA